MSIKKLLMMVALTFCGNDIAFCMQANNLQFDAWHSGANANHSSKKEEQFGALSDNLISTNYKKGCQQRLVGDIKKLRGEALLDLLHSKAFLNMLARTNINISFIHSVYHPHEEKVVKVSYIFDQISRAELIQCLPEIQQHCAEYAIFSYVYERDDDQISLSSLDSTMSMKLIPVDPRSQYIDKNGDMFRDEDIFLKSISLATKLPMDEIPPEREVILRTDIPYDYKDIINILNKYPEYATFFLKNKSIIKIFKDGQRIDSDEAIDMTFLECGVPTNLVQ